MYGGKGKKRKKRNQNNEWICVKAVEKQCTRQTTTTYSREDEEGEGPYVLYCKPYGTNECLGWAGLVACVCECDAERYFRFSSLSKPGQGRIMRLPRSECCWQAGTHAVRSVRSKKTGKKGGEKRKKTPHKDMTTGFNY